MFKKIKKSLTMFLLIFLLSTFSFLSLKSGQEIATQLEQVHDFFSIKHNDLYLTFGPVYYSQTSNEASYYCWQLCREPESLEDDRLFITCKLSKIFLKEDILNFCDVDGRLKPDAKIELAASLIDGLKKTSLQKISNDLELPLTTRQKCLSCGTTLWLTLIFVAILSLNFFNNFLPEVTSPNLNCSFLCISLGFMLYQFKQFKIADINTQNFNFLLKKTIQELSENCRELQATGDARFIELIGGISLINSKLINF